MAGIDPIAASAIGRGHLARPAWPTGCTLALTCRNICFDLWFLMLVEVLETKDWTDCIPVPAVPSPSPFTNGLFLSVISSFKPWRLVIALSYWVAYFEAVAWAKPGFGFACLPSDFVGFNWGKACIYCEFFILNNCSYIPIAIYTK